RTMGLITQAESDAANEEPFEGNIVPRTTKKNTRVERDFGAAGGEYVAEWVRRQLSNAPFGAAIGIDETSLYDAGLRVYLTIDPARQKAASQAVNSQLVGEADPAAALVSIDERGRVAALIGGQNYGADQVNLALGPEYGA